MEQDMTKRDFERAAKMGAQVNADQQLKYVESIIHNEQKCYYYKKISGGNLHCHWKESKKMAEYIFQIYDYIIEARYKNDR